MYLAFRDRMPQWLQDEFDHYSAVLRKILFLQHKTDGSHDVITAERVTLNTAAGVYALSDGSYVTLRDGILTLYTKEGQFRVMRGIEAVADQEAIRVGDATDPADQSYTGMPVTTLFEDTNLQKRLRLGTIVDIADGYAPGDFTLGATAEAGTNFGANRILYRLAPSFAKGFNGIYNQTGNARMHGQVVIIWNDSAFNVAVGALKPGGPTAYQHIITPTFTLAPQGTAMFVYDALYNWGLAVGGWRCVSAVQTTLGLWTPYTPVWGSTAGPAPVMGASVATGSYMRSGKTVEFYAMLTLGAGFAFGGGTNFLTLPSQIVAGFNPIIPAAASIGGARYTGSHILTNSGGNGAALALTNGAPSALWAVAVPAAWAAGSVWMVNGTYQEA